MSSRVYLVIVTSIVIGIALPITFLLTINNEGQLDNYGSCLVKVEHRFKYEINQIQDYYNNLENCSKLGAGCWEDHCYHSVPSSFQYYVSNPVDYISKPSNRTKTRKQSPKVGDGSSLVDFAVEIDIKPVKNVDSTLRNYKARITWYSTDILSIRFYDPSNPPPGLDVDLEEVDNVDEGLRVGIHEFKVEYPDVQDDFFYIRISRMNTMNDLKETIFESRLGPLQIYDRFFTFGTSLPSKYFYGIKGGQGITDLGSSIVDGVNTLGQNELPFYMVRERSGKMHGVLIETRFPFVAQVIGGPGIMFEFERSEGQVSVPLSLKIFTGPTPTNVLSQFSAYMQEKTALPPYWGLGLHLCRKTRSVKRTLDEIKQLSNDSELRIPYDSDCITENLRTPFEIDSKTFPNLDAILDELQIDPTYRRRRVLSQKLMQGKGQVDPEDLEMFILNEKHDPFDGVVDKNLVNYYSIFNEKTKREIEKRFEVPGKLFDGLVLVDNLPKHENASVDYNEDKAKYKNSRIQSNFSSPIWGTVSPTSRHLKPVINTSYNMQEALEPVVENLELSNVYGEEALKFFSELMKKHVASAQIRTDEKTIVSTSSMWTKSFAYGGFNGIDVPFTWEGLRNSLSTFIRYFMFNPYGGIPVCGSYQIDEDPFDQELCLRWFQTSLLLPFVRNTYDGVINSNTSRGPTDFNKKYQKHLITNIRQRYALNPYYYTLFQQYTKTGVPPILPLSFYFQDDNNFNYTFPILDQFMIGPALMAAPIVNYGTSRQAYFPKGFWYTFDGEVAFDNTEIGDTLHVSALINYVPLFIRDGYIIPTLLNTEALTAEASRAGNYTLMATFPKTREISSSGFLYMDDGVSLNSELSGYLVSFNLNRTHFHITTPGCTFMGPLISTTVDEIRIIGIHRKPTNVQNSITGEFLPRKSIVFDSERSVLRLLSLNINWCDNNGEAIISWDSL